MGNMQKTAIIIPCYNEADRLKCDSILKFAKANNEIYFIIVNDGSTDNTWQVITELAKVSNGQIISLDLETNLGKAEAVRQGFLKAFSKQVGFLNP